MLACAPASAWTDEVRTRMVRDAVKLMPRSLQRMMEHHDRSLLQGMLSPGSPEDQPEHWQHPDGNYGSAAQEVEEAAAALVAAVGNRAPFHEVIRRFGALAHWTMDVGDPLRAGDRDPALKDYYRDYERYVEQQLPRFRLVFLGYRSETLTDDGPREFMMESADRSNQYAQAIRRGYDDEGRRRSRQAFDERSIAFAVGSLAYSHAVNDISKLWIWAWENCNGDTTRTPFPLEPPEEERTGGRAALEGRKP